MLRLFAAVLLLAPAVLATSLDDDGKVAASNIPPPQKSDLDTAVQASTRNEGTDGGEGGDSGRLKATDLPHALLQSDQDTVQATSKGDSGVEALLQDTDGGDGGEPVGAWNPAHDHSDPDHGRSLGWMGEAEPPTKTPTPPPTEYPSWSPTTSNPTQSPACALTGNDDLLEECCLGSDHCDCTAQPTPVCACEEDDAGLDIGGNAFNRIEGKDILVDAIGNVQTLHGAVMGLAWSTAATVGVLTARYFRHKKSWFPIHRACMTVGSAGTLALAAVAIGFVTGQQAMLPHHVLGLAVAGLTGVQVTVGAAAHDAHAKGITGKKITYFERLHRNLGKLIIVCAYVNVYLGMSILAPDNKILFGFYYVYVPCVLTAFVVLEVRLQRAKDLRGDYGILAFFRTLCKRGPIVAVSFICASEANRHRSNEAWCARTGHSLDGNLKPKGDGDEAGAAAVRPSQKRRRTKAKLQQTRSEMHAMLAGKKTSAAFTVTGKLIYRGMNDRLQAGPDELVARFERVLQDIASEEDYAVVEAAIENHKVTDQKQRRRRKTQPLLDNVATPLDFAASLREVLEKAEPPLIREHTYRKRKFPFSFLASDAVQVMVHARLVKDETMAIEKGNWLMEAGLIKSVDDPSFDKEDGDVFLNEHLLYQFRDVDGDGDVDADDVAGHEGAEIADDEDEDGGGGDAAPSKEGAAAAGTPEAKEKDGGQAEAATKDAKDGGEVRDGKLARKETRELADAAGPPTEAAKEAAAAE